MHCEIIGTPTVAATQATYTMTARNAAGSDTATVSITITATPLALARPSLANAAAATLTENSAAGLPIRFTNSGGGALTRCAVSPTLPSGLTVRPTSGNASCEITGTPDAAIATNTYTVTATNATGSGTATVSITVNLLSVPILANVTTARTFTLDTPVTPIPFTNTGGGALTSCTVSNPDLPAGLMASRTTGNASCQITGTPTAAATQATYTMTARNAAGAGTATVSITVNAVLPDLADVAAAQTFTVGTPAPTITFTNTGGGRLTACTVSNPDLPVGLVASRTTGNASCQITGTPGNTAAVATYTMTATNAAGPATATVSITVAPPLPDLQNITQAAMLTVNRQAPTITFRNTGGGDIPAGGCAVSPALPMGLTVGRTSGGVSCEIFGTPDTAASTATYMVTATNSAGADASPATVSITVEAAIEPPLLANAGAIIHTVNTALTAVSFPNTGGAANRCGVTPPLPMGLAVEPTTTTTPTSCQITGMPTAEAASATYTVTASNAGGNGSATIDIAIVTAQNAANVDADGDGLIEISTLAQLNNIRFSLDGTKYKTSASDTGLTTGCPLVSSVATCIGYELAASLDFDGSDADTTSWTRASDGTYTLDADDTDSTYFAIASNAGGWVPIGDNNTNTDASRFTATFEGNGHTISNLASVAATARHGLFGTIGTGAEIRNLRIANSLFRGTGTGGAHIVGTLAGVQFGGTISNVHIVDSHVVSSPAADGEVGGLVGRIDGGGSVVGSSVSSSVGGSVSSRVEGAVAVDTTSGDAVGGLAGSLFGGGVVSHSSASAAVFSGGGGAGGGPARAGGLVGLASDDTSTVRIVASYATGAITGSDTANTLGGLVGNLANGADILASYATGAINGAGGADSIGGLVGEMSASNAQTANPTITAVYATGTLDGDAGSDSVGGLVGFQAHGAISASYAISAATAGASGQVGRLVGNQDTNPSSTAAITLSWGFGATTGGGSTPGVHGSVSSGTTLNLPSGVTTAAGLTATNAGTLWNDAASFTAGAWDFGDATQNPALNFADYDGAAVGTSPNYTSGHIYHCASDAANAPTDYVTAHLLPDCAQLILDQFRPRPMLPVVDADNNGLIDIGTLAQLHNMRHNPDGTSYMASATATPNANGCPGNVCIGYELIHSLNFDADRDGSSWTRASDGTITLDEDDHHDTYFDIATGGVSGGWLPIGHCGGDRCSDNPSTPVDESANNTQFATILEGNGHSIIGVANIGNNLNEFSGLFGAIDGGHIRNLGVVNSLVVGPADARTRAGALAGFLDAGSITNSHATGSLIVGLGSNVSDQGKPLGGNVLGGLVGLSDGDITASFASGRLESVGDHTFDHLGGLMGEMRDGTIVGSYSTADAHSGGGKTDRVGGLVGDMDGGTIAASFATGTTGAGDGDEKSIGGLVGNLDGGTIVGSWASGDSRLASLASKRSVGALVGTQSGTVTASWGFGTPLGGNADSGSDGSSDRPSGVTLAEQLTTANTPTEWDAAASLTNDAWNLGSAMQVPLLTYADYDGATMGTAGAYTSGHLYHCESDAANAPAGAIIVPNCGTLLPAIIPTNQTANGLTFIIISPVSATAYIVLVTDGTPAPVGTAIKVGTVGAGGVVATGTGILVANTRVGVSITGLDEETDYDAYLVLEIGGVLGQVHKIDLTTPPEVPDLQDGPTISFNMGSIASFTFTNDGGGSIPARGCSVSPALPTGLSASATSDGTSCQISGTPTAVTATATYMVTARNGSGPDATPASLTFEVQPPLVDADGDGLIEIDSLAKLSNIRHSLDGSKYKTSFSDSGNATGCPNDVCIGYELVMDLDFDADGDGSSWTRSNTGTYTLDEGDKHDTYFPIVTGGSAGGWSPIISAGGTNLPFTGVFEGNGHTISNLATNSAVLAVGLFGAIGDGAIVRNVHLVDNLAKSTSVSAVNVGGLVGTQAGGAIIGCSTSGEAEPGTGDNSNVGGLVGQLTAGYIVASRAAGPVRGFTAADRAGGLVGHLSGSGIITASFATGAVTGGLGADRVGGLVGYAQAGTLGTSYATGAVNGDGADDTVGGLVGHSEVALFASYATGAVDGGAGTMDRGGQLGGLLRGNISHAFGYGTLSGAEQPVRIPGSPPPTEDGANGRPASPQIMTLANTGNTWNLTTNSTLGAWDFGTNAQTPALNYADYDGAGTVFGCGSVAGVTVSLRPRLGCGSLIEGQGRTPTAPTPALPDLADNTATHTLIPERLIRTNIAFTNSGGGSLTRCQSLPTLPGGLTLAITADATSCEISGRPDVPSAANSNRRITYRILATNATGDDATPAAVIIIITPPLLDAPNLTDVAEADALSFTAGVPLSPPYLFENTGGELVTACTATRTSPGPSSGLPMGLMLAPTADETTCEITGTPTRITPQATYTISAMNKYGTGTSTVVIVVTSPTPGLTPPALVNAPATTFHMGSLARLRFTNTGGGHILATGGCTVTPPLPTGLSPVPTADSRTCEITGTPTALAAEREYTISATNLVGPGTSSATVSIEVLGPTVDADGDGLIDIDTLTRLHNMRHSLDGSKYKTSGSDAGDTTGCPLVNGVATCRGYELVDNLDFDADGDGSSWTRASDGTYTLDEGDNNTTYFAIPTGGASGGWSPIGAQATPFTAIFEGNGYTISNLATIRGATAIGLFGVIDGSAIVRNVHLDDNLAKSSVNLASDVGGLVGWQKGGQIIASSTSGEAESSSGGGTTGGLVGSQTSGHIVGSYATGPVRGFTGADNVGGLVGNQSGTSLITASYATGAVTGGTGADNAGGLVGRMQSGGTPAIRASYATGAANGDAGNDRVGGFVGDMAAGTIRASYATGAASGAADTDRVGAFAGNLLSMTLLGSSRSWGYGAIDSTEETGSSSGDGGRPSSAAAIAATNAGAVWNAATSGTLNAWDFGTGTQTPAVRFADYDGIRLAAFHCGASTAPAGALVIPVCGQLVPGQGRTAVPPALALPNLASDATAYEFTARRAITAIVFINEGGGSLTACTVTSSALPAGLVAEVTGDGDSCEITGTPTVEARAANYSIIATNASGDDASPATVNIAVEAPPAPPMLANADDASFPASSPITPIDFTNSGGINLTSCVPVTPLPMGLAVATNGDNTSCQITGTPTALTAQATYTIRAINGLGMSDATIRITVTAPVELDAPLLINASVATLTEDIATGLPIMFTNKGGGSIGASGCTVSPALPMGLSVAPTIDGTSCEIKGTPTEPAAVNTYAVTATNAAGNSTATVSIVVVSTQDAANVDADGDGLIEIDSLTKLNNMRYNLNGTSYKTSDSDPGLTTGCPLVSSVATCIGYELTTSLDFDADGDGSSWSRATDGTLTLDAGDNNDTYFAIPSGGASGGWVPIGDCGPDKRCGGNNAADNRSFNAVFDGGGHTISGLAIMRDLDFVGLFGVLDAGALITNLGLEGSLVKNDRLNHSGQCGRPGGQLAGRRHCRQPRHRQPCRGQRWQPGSDRRPGGLASRRHHCRQLHHRRCR